MTLTPRIWLALISFLKLIEEVCINLAMGQAWVSAPNRPGQA